MNRSITLLSAVALCASQIPALAMEHAHRMDMQGSGGGAMAQTETSHAAQGHGVINSVDAAGRSVNITHEPIPSLSWPSMTMDLPVTEQVDLSAVRPGDAVDFQVQLGSDAVYRITRIGGAD